MINFFLSFSDAAKFADVARNLVNGLGFGGSFTFWGNSVFGLLNQKNFPAMWDPPIMPFSIATSFKIFGVGDFAVIATSIFYFILTLIFVFLLGKKIYDSKLTGALSVLAVGFNYDLINYATSGASESPFIFEIIAAGYFATLKKSWANIITGVILALMYFTRPQAFIYIAGVILYWLLLNFKLKKAIIYFFAVMIAGLFADYFILRPLSGRFFLYSLIFRWSTSSFSQSSSASDVLRGAATGSGGYAQLMKNIFYNIYNFYKLLPQIINPYLFAIFIIGLYKWGKGKVLNSFKAASIFMVFLTILVTAASIPFFRYIHPVVPLVYIIAVGTLVEILSYQFSKKLGLILSSTFLILFFGVGQTIGIFLLDSRFEANTHNVGKPPVYVELAYKLRDNTNKDDVVLTNLDTWGSWYGERKTVWYPLMPKQIIDPSTGKIPFDAIYLTSYLMDDQNYYMGADWRLIFNNPNDPKKWKCDGCAEIAKEFELKSIYKIPIEDDYERLDAKAILLIRK